MMLRRLYNWVTGWSESPYGTLALFCLAFAESSFFPVPPDVLLIALCVGKPKKAVFYAAVCTAGSLIGGIAGYGIGVFAFDTIGERLINLYDHERIIFGRIQNLYELYGFWGILIAAITPIPYKIFTIASGVFKFSFPMFMMASAIGRSFRFFLVGGLIFLGGAKLKEWIERYFDILAWVFLALLAGGFLIIKLI